MATCNEKASQTVRQRLIIGEAKRMVVKTRQGHRSIHCGRPALAVFAGSPDETAVDARRE
jgi:hypothetical protein